MTQLIEKDLKWSFSSLWHPGAKEHCRLSIVDTVLVDNGKLVSWLFTSSKGLVLRKNESNLAAETVATTFKSISAKVWREFLERDKTGPQNPEGIVVTFANGAQEVITFDRVYEYLAKLPENVHILQPYLPLKDTTIHKSITSNYEFHYSLDTEINLPRHRLFKRCPPEVTGPSYTMGDQSDQFALLQCRDTSLKEEIGSMISSAVRYMESHRRIRVKDLVADVVVDAEEQIHISRLSKCSILPLELDSDGQRASDCVMSPSKLTRTRENAFQRPSIDDKSSSTLSAYYEGPSAMEERVLRKYRAEAEEAVMSMKNNPDDPSSANVKDFRDTLLAGGSMMASPVREKHLSLHSPAKGTKLGQTRSLRPPARNNALEDYWKGSDAVEVYKRRRARAAESLGSSQLSGCAGDFCSYGLSSSPSPGEKNLGEYGVKTKMSVDKFNRIMGRTNNSMPNTQQRSLVGLSTSHSRKKGQSGKLSANFPSARRKSNSETSEGSEEHLDPDDATPSVMYKIPFKCVAVAREERKLVELLLSRHARQEEGDYLTPEQLDLLCNLGEEFPGHYYGQVDVCDSCFKVYQLVEDEREAALRKVLDEEKHQRRRRAPMKRRMSYGSRETPGGGGVEVYESNELKDGKKVNEVRSGSRNSAEIHEVNDLNLSSSSNSSNSPDKRGVEEVSPTRLSSYHQYLGSFGEALGKKDIVELRAFPHPPPAVSMVVSALTLLLTGQELTWQESRKLMSNADKFLALLAGFDVESAGRGRVQLLRPYIANPYFHPEHILPICKAAAKCCEWILTTLKQYSADCAVYNGHLSMEGSLKLLSGQKDSSLDIAKVKEHRSTLKKKAKTGGMIEGAEIVHKTSTTSVTKGRWNAKLSLPAPGQRKSMKKKLQKLQKRQMERLCTPSYLSTSSAAKDKGISMPGEECARYFTCRDGQTRMPYVVMGTPSVDELMEEQLRQDPSMLGDDAAAGRGPSNTRVKLSFSQKRERKRERQREQGERSSAQPHKVSLIVVHDFFDTFEQYQILLRNVARRNLGCQILLFNYPGQANTCFPLHESSSSPAAAFSSSTHSGRGKSSLSGQTHTETLPQKVLEPSHAVHKLPLNNVWLAEKVYELLEHVDETGEFPLGARPFYLMGIGNGASVATALAAIYRGAQTSPQVDELFGAETELRPSSAKNSAAGGREQKHTGCARPQPQSGARLGLLQGLQGCVFVNGFLHVDDQLAAILHNLIQVYSCFPPNRPDLPISYFSKFIFSDAYLQSVDKRLILNLFTAVANPITLRGRIGICEGALQHVDLRESMRYKLLDAETGDDVAAEGGGGVGTGLSGACGLRCSKDVGDPSGLSGSTFSAGATGSSYSTSWTGSTGFRGSSGLDGMTNSSSGAGQRKSLAFPKVPIILVQSTDDSLVAPTNADSFLTGRRISNMWSHHLESSSSSNNGSDGTRRNLSWSDDSDDESEEEDKDQDPDEHEVQANSTAVPESRPWQTRTRDRHFAAGLKAQRRFGEKGMRSLRETLALDNGAFVYWIKSGHEIRQEGKQQLLELVGALFAIGAPQRRDEWLHNPQRQNQRQVQQQTRQAQQEQRQRQQRSPVTKPSAAHMSSATAHSDGLSLLECETHDVNVFRSEARPEFPRGGKGGGVESSGGGKREEEASARETCIEGSQETEVSREREREEEGLIKSRTETAQKTDVRSEPGFRSLSGTTSVNKEAQSGSGSALRSELTMREHCDAEEGKKVAGSEDEKLDSASETHKLLAQSVQASLPRFTAGDSGSADATKSTVASHSPTQSPINCVKQVRSHEDPETVSPSKAAVDGEDNGRDGLDHIERDTQIDGNGGCLSHGELHSIGDILHGGLQTLAQAQCRTEMKSVPDLSPRLNEGKALAKACEPQQNACDVERDEDDEEELKLIAQMKAEQEQRRQQWAREDERRLMMLDMDMRTDRVWQKDDLHNSVSALGKGAGGLLSKYEDGASFLSRKEGLASLYLRCDSDTGPSEASRNAEVLREKAQPVKVRITAEGTHVAETKVNSDSNQTGKGGAYVRPAECVASAGGVEILMPASLKGTSFFDQMEKEEEERNKARQQRLEIQKRVKEEMEDHYSFVLQEDAAVRQREKELKEEYAAVNIQRLSRGRKARKDAQRLREEKRRQKLEEDAGATITRVARGCLGRLKAHRVREEKDLARRQTAGAIDIQRCFRGHKGREQVNSIRREKATSVIQRTYRGHQGRQKARDRVQEKMEEARKAKAATLIQATWKMKREKNFYEERRVWEYAAIEIQRIWRGKMARLNYARKMKWEMTEPGPERLALGLQLIEDKKKAFAKQQEEIDLLYRAQEHAEHKISTISLGLKESEKELESLEIELQELDAAEKDIIGLSRERDLLWLKREEEAKAAVVATSPRRKSQLLQSQNNLEKEASELEVQLREKKIERERKRKELTADFAEVSNQVLEKKRALAEMERKIEEMEETRQRKEREFGRMQSNLMELLEEQRIELESLREKGIELEEATAVSATAAAKTAMRAKENEERSKEMFESTEELMKFQFMSMSLSYFSSLNMLQNLKKMNSDTANAAISASADTAAAAAAAAAACNLPMLGSPGRSVLSRPSDFPKDRLADLQDKQATSTRMTEEYLRSRSNPSRADKVTEATLERDEAEIKKKKEGHFPSDVRLWTVSDVCRWLDVIALPQYIEAFREASIDGEFLLELREEDMRSVLGMEHKLHVTKVMLLRDKLRPLSAKEESLRQDMKTEETAQRIRSNKIALKDVKKSKNPGEAVAVKVPDAETVFSQCRNSRFKRLQESIQHGFNVNTADENGNTLLLIACQNVNVKIVQYLLERGADINHQNANGNTALHFAMVYDAEGTLGELLIEHGADDTLENKFGLSPYDGLSLEA